MKLISRHTTLFLLSACAIWAQPQAPGKLQAVTATKSAVQLSWQSADSSIVNFQVDRRPLAVSGIDYVAISTGKATTYTDTAIDAMTTYVYRVRGIDGTGVSSGGSNEIIVGPPPVGSSVISTVRADLNLYDPSSQFGVRPLMTLDSNGDPAICYSILSPNNLDVGTPDDSFLEFISWDRTQYSWKAPVKVAVTGDNGGTGGGANSYSFARDAATNTWAIASTFSRADYANSDVRLFTSSDNGATWKTITAFTSSVYQLVNPSVAVASGNVHVSFYYDSNGIAYLTGKLSDDPSKWKLMIAPLPAGATDYRQENHLALDSKGKPGLVFCASGDSYNTVIAYWRPGDGTSTYVMDSNQFQNDYAEVKLGYFGTFARIAMQLLRDDQGPSGYDRFFWIAADQGASDFAAPVGLPSDGNSDLGYGSLALGSSGQASLVTAVTGGNDGGVKCGTPKITTSTDLVNWFTCSPYKANPQPYRDTYWPQAAYAVNDKLYIAMTNYDYSSPLYGVILWREQ